MAKRRKSSPVSSAIAADTLNVETLPLIVFGPKGITQMILGGDYCRGPDVLGDYAGCAEQAVLQANPSINIEAIIVGTGEGILLPGRAFHRVVCLVRKDRRRRERGPLPMLTIRCQNQHRSWYPQLGRWIPRSSSPGKMRPQRQRAFCSTGNF